MNKLIISFCAIVMLMGFSTTAIQAQGQGPSMKEASKMLVDTSYVLATEVTFKPGYKSEWHTHPAHFYYALTDGELRVTYEDGNVVSFPVKAGDSGFSMPEGPHFSENPGKKPLKFILVELKEHPYKAQMQ